MERVASSSGCRVPPKADAGIAPFHVLTPTFNSFAPSTILLLGLPTVPDGAPAQGYQGGAYLVNEAYPDGEAIYEPWEQGLTTPIGVVLGYKGGPQGVFPCVDSVTCSKNWEWFDLTKLPLTVPTGYSASPTAAATGSTCGFIQDNLGRLYFIPGLMALNNGPAMVRYDGLGLTNASSYEGFLIPYNGTAVANMGTNYGWCTGVFDGRYVYYAPTVGGITLHNSNFLRYDTLGPGGFVMNNFSSYDLVNDGAGSNANGANSCCFLSSAFDGQQKIYLLPEGSYLTVYDTTASSGFTDARSYKFLNLANLGTPRYPQVKGNGNLSAIRTLQGYVGAQMVWNAKGTFEYLYMGPFAGNPEGVSQSDQMILSDVIRVPVASCSPGKAGAQACIGKFTAFDITSAGSTWEIFDLIDLTTNPAWSAAGFAFPATFTTGPLINQPTVGGFQLTWLNVHDPSDPIVGFVPDFGLYVMRHHATHSLSDPAGWDVALRPLKQANGCMGGGYDPINQWLYLSCPAATPIASVWQDGPL